MRYTVVAVLLISALATSLAGADEPETSAHLTGVYPWAGETYYFSTVRRSGSRARGTTLRALAAAYAGNSTAKQQEQEQQPKTAAAKKQLKREKEVMREQQRLFKRMRRQRPSGRLPRKARPDPALEVARSGGGKGGPPTATVDQSFDGLNIFNQRYANNGNQYTLDPPDQGLCVGNGYVLETVNTVLQVFDARSGAPLIDPLALTQFYQLPDQYDSTTGLYGPFMGDPSCWYDTDSKRWFHVLFTADTNPTFGNFTGPTYLDVAVSDSADPTGSWNLYRIPASNDGSDGTPDVGCDGGYCFPDYPQIAVWESALIITTNEFAVFGTGFYGANVYAVEKTALVAGAAEATTALVRTGGYPANGDLVVSNLMAARQVGYSRLGLENTYIMATPDERSSTPRQWVNHLQLLCLTGTGSLRARRPDVRLSWINKRLRLNIEFTAPSPATQRDGVNPLGIVAYNNAPVAMLDALDARMTSLTFADDCMLYAAWGSAVQVDGGESAGVAWAVVDLSSFPHRSKRDGLVGLAGGNSLLMPYLAVRPGGIGVMSFSVSGPSFYPSAGFGVLTSKGLGQLQLVPGGDGVGVLDSYTGYTEDGSVGVARFGDYGAGVFVDAEGVFWFASEWVAQSCTVAEWRRNPTCGGTRTYYTNWATRVTQVTLSTPWHLDG